MNLERLNKLVELAKQCVSMDVNVDEDAAYVNFITTIEPEDLVGIGKYIESLQEGVLEQTQGLDLTELLADCTLGNSHEQHFEHVLMQDQIDFWREVWVEERQKREAAEQIDYFDFLVATAKVRAQKAMVKFPQPNYVLNKVAEESGELIKEVVHFTEGRGDWSKVEYELIDNIAMLFRLMTEGDGVIGFEIPPEVKQFQKSCEKPVTDDKLHPMTAKLVSDFSEALGAKLLRSEQKYGWSDGWLKDNWKDDCLRDFHHHITKGDPIDVAAYCAFMWYHGWATEGQK